MDGANISLYSVGIAAILLSVYIFPSFYTENFLSKIVPIFEKWFTESKLQAIQESDNAIELDDPALENVLQYSPSWWSDDNIFQLERRAIFSKQWFFVTHTSRFHKPGDYRTFEIAGFSFILILGKDEQIRAFHNVCRHRAYTVTKKESGSSTVLGCRYHGWSYDTKGKLIKAPEFEGVEGFDKEQNSLWKLQTEVRDSMVFVNLYAGQERQPLELEASETILRRWKASDLEWTTGWKVDGIFNWKLVAGELSLDQRKEPGESLWASILATWQNTQEKELKISHTTIIRQLPSGQLLTIRILPRSPVATTIQCDIYARKPRSSKAEQKERNFLKDLILLEVKKLEIRQQELLGYGEVASRGQDELSGLLKAHLAAERALGTEIHPAARKQSFTVDGKADDDLCAELENDLVCKANKNGLLDW